MKIKEMLLKPRWTALAAFVFSIFTTPGKADPLINSWFTLDAGQFARIYQDDTDKRMGKTVTTWDSGRLAQVQPAYTGVQAVFSSADWVYVMSTGLGNHVMGPWYLDPQHFRAFPNLPTDQHFILRLPRHPTPQTDGDFNPLGEVGMFVDGVRMFDATDALSYSTQNGRDADPRSRIGHGDRIWNRDAYVNERVTFDAALGHQQNRGTYHYHAEPLALRYLLGDHVDFDPAAKTYTESKTPPVKHSPILGWMHDGYPVYGPYGYSNPTNAASGVRRMVSGFILRDGANGADNLRQTGRHSWPKWAAREFGRPATLSPNQFGPNVTAMYPLGHYIEDYAYLGDSEKSKRHHWDLDELNGRWCVTPEFPNGTYAYFTTIDAAAMPVYPYNMGRRYHGVPAGRLVRAISEPVTTNFYGHADFVSTTAPSTGTVTLVWKANSAGGDYQPGPR